MEGEKTVRIGDWITGKLGRRKFKEITLPEAEVIRTKEINELIAYSCWLNIADLSIIECYKLGSLLTDTAKRMEIINKEEVGN